MHVVDFADGRLLTVELLAIPACRADLIHRFVTRDGVVTLAHDGVWTIGPLVGLLDFELYLTAAPGKKFLLEKSGRSVVFIVAVWARRRATGREYQCEKREALQEKLRLGHESAQT